MAYKEQLAEWLKKHPNATKEECMEAAYGIATKNWCTRRR